jgi:hypothetical protein
LVSEAVDLILKTGRRIVDGLTVLDAIDAFLYAMSPTELNSGEDLLVAQMNAAVEPPETLMPPLLDLSYITVRAQAAWATLPVAPDRALRLL